MKRILLGIGLALGGTNLHSMCNLDCYNDNGLWLYVGGTGKYTTIKNKEFTLSYTGMLNEPLEAFAEDLVNIKLNSAGVAAGTGILFPTSFLAFDFAYTRCYSSTGHSATTFQGSTSIGEGPLSGNFYTYEVRWGYFFQPLCDNSWSLYPLLAYNCDNVTLKFTKFPNSSSVIPGTTIEAFVAKEKILLQGPSIGIGSVYCLPFDLVLSGEASWQFRVTREIGKFGTTISSPVNDTLTLFKESNGFNNWTHGPKIDLNIDYFYCNWFVRLTGEWQYLFQLTTGEGFTNIKSVTTLVSTDAIFRTSNLESPRNIHNLQWNNWVWKAAIGYSF